MNLVVGNSSQLSKYFPEDYIRISSRDVDLEYLRSNKWEAAYITFAEQRIHEPATDFVTPNYHYTLQIIDALLDSTDKIVCYTSCELWNQASGYIDADTPPNFYPFGNEYALSKLLLWNKILELRKFNSLYNKVIFLHPFYFNSVHRSKYFLFGKIFDSIVNKTKISVGNINFSRDMVHAKYVVKKSLEADRDAVVGCGGLLSVGLFIKILYKHYNMDFDEYVTVDDSAPSLGRDKSIWAKMDTQYTYLDLFKDTFEDLDEAMKRYDGNNR